MDKEEQLSAKLTNVCNENELCIKCVSFKWASAKGMMNATRTNHCNKKDLRFEVLKVINVNEVAEHEHEIASAKEMLGNAEANQRKVFLGTEQRAGKMKRMCLQ